MKQNILAEFYKKYFADMQLERAVLFEVIQQHYGNSCKTVLYPGSYIHVTPSFAFPHVVYVDKSEATRQSFADLEGVIQFISRNKHYRQKPFVRFIDQDFTTSLPVPEKSFDLLISLYAPGIAASCTRYLKPGGLLLSNNHHDDAGWAARSGNFQLLTVVTEKRGQYMLSEHDLNAYFVPKPPGLTKAPMKMINRHPEYTKNADYYVFKRVR